MMNTVLKNHRGLIALVCSLASLWTACSVSSQPPTINSAWGNRPASYQKPKAQRSPTPKAKLKKPCPPVNTPGVSTSSGVSTSDLITGSNTSISSNCQMQDQPNGIFQGKTGNLSGHRWTLQRLGEKAVQGSSVYIEFDAQQQRISGDSGCNLFGGNFASSGQTLTISGMTSTQRACFDETLQRMELEVVRSLETVTRYQIQADTLRLYAGDRAVLVFSRANQVLNR